METGTEEGLSGDCSRAGDSTRGEASGVAKWASSGSGDGGRSVSTGGREGSARDGRGGRSELELSIAGDGGERGGDDGEEGVGDEDSEDGRSGRGSLAGGGRLGKGGDGDCVTGVASQAGAEARVWGTASDLFPAREKSG